jgi:predicted ATP-dependent serine protease
LRERAEEQAHEPDRTETPRNSNHASEIKNSRTPWRSSIELIDEPELEIDYIVPGIIPSESVILLSGREGTMKSLLMLKCMSRIADGAEWLGSQCIKAPVLYIDAEMPYKLFIHRVRAVGLSENLHFWHHSQDRFPSSLDDPRLIEAAKAHRVIVIDPLKRFMNGLNENSSTEMANVTGAMRHLVTRGKCAIVAVHHSVKQADDGGYRGSTELGAGVDIAVNLKVEQREDSKILRLNSSKTRYADEIKLTLKVMQTAQGLDFCDISSDAKLATHTALHSELDKLRLLISLLKETLGRPPKQVEVVEKAKESGLAPAIRSSAI